MRTGFIKQSLNFEKSTKELRGDQKNLKPVAVLSYGLD
jgi:hypothetical protein